MENSNCLFELGLALTPGIGTTLAKRLLDATGSAEAIFKAKPSTLLEIPGIGNKVIAGLSEKWVLSRAEEELLFMSKHKVKSVFLSDPVYPERLKNCQDSPIILFYKGDLPSKMRHSLSIIGTREPTANGRQLAINWVEELARQYPDIYIISGLAYGIDIAAHEAALKSHSKTIAILGHGLHTIYPHAHRSTAIKILEEGALVTDFFSNNLKEPKNFIRRNRIIAGITEATLVIESQLKGGAMATAEMANSYNREVFAVPGRPMDKNAVGCNYLIRSNQASIVYDLNDIPFLLGWDPMDKKTKGDNITSAILPDLSDFQKRIMELLIKDEMNINEMGLLLKIHPAKLAGDLLNMEFAGLIKASPGGRFRADSDYFGY